MDERTYELVSYHHDIKVDYLKSKFDLLDHKYQKLQDLYIQQKKNILLLQEEVKVLENKLVEQSVVHAYEVLELRKKISKLVSDNCAIAQEEGAPF